MDLNLKHLNMLILVKQRPLFIIDITLRIININSLRNFPNVYAFRFYCDSFRTFIMFIRFTMISVRNSELLHLRSPCSSSNKLISKRIQFLVTSFFCENRFDVCILFQTAQLHCQNWTCEQ